MPTGPKNIVSMIRAAAVLELLHRPDRGRAGVVDEHVDAVEPCRCGRDRGVGLRAVGHVERDGQRAFRRGGDQIVKRLGLTCGGDDAITVRQRRFGERTAEPRRAAGDHPGSIHAPTLCSRPTSGNGRFDWLATGVACGAMVDLPELRLLRTFTIVAAEGSLSRAAKHLRMTQQSVSQQVRQLERTVGAPLLERSSRGVTLTAVGEVLLRETASVLAGAERAMDTARRAARGEAVPCASASSPHSPTRSSRRSSASSPMSGPTSSCTPKTCPSPLSWPAFARAASTRQSPARRWSTTSTRRSSAPRPVAVALPPGHRLPTATSLRLADLADETWVMTPRSSWPPWHRKYDEEFAAAGFRPKIATRGTTPQGLLALVAAGVGITRLAQVVAQPPFRGRSLRRARG